MIKQSKSGEAMLGSHFETHDEKYKWVGQDGEVRSDPLVDSGTGTPVVMRFFEFQGNSEALKKHVPNDQELFNTHAHQIRLMLWGDGLEPLEVIPPRIMRSKNKLSYRIMVLCIPKKGVALNDSTQTLQQLTKQNGN